jgi:hypothetical protein
LHSQQIRQCSGGMHREIDLVRDLRLPGFREVHRGRIVDDQLTTQVGLFFVAFDEELFGTAEEFPIDVPGRFAGIVEPVLGEFHGETMKRTFVQPGDESLHYLLGKQFEVTETLDLLLIDRHGIKDNESLRAVLKSKERPALGLTALLYASRIDQAIWAFNLLARIDFGTAPTCLSTT